MLVKLQNPMVVALGLILLSSCKSSETTPKEAEPVPAVTETTPVTEATPLAKTSTTVNDFFSAGAPSFVVGTLGDDRSDRIVDTQVRLIRGFISQSTRLEDSTIKVGSPDSWPEQPVLYGGAHINSTVRDLGDTLPLQITANKLRIAGQSFDGVFQLVAVIPEQANHPEFTLFAGTGTPGIAEINALKVGKDSILIADSFGQLHTGSWKREGQKWVATLSPAARRIPWRQVETKSVNIAFVESLPPRDDEAALIKDCEAGVATTIAKLGLDTPKPITIYISPDARSKVSLTGKGGQGHALPEFQVLHVVAMGKGALQDVIAHEATHLLAYAAFGQAGSSLLGEGIAVWVAGQYAGTPIDNFGKTLGRSMTIDELLGPMFRKLPEQEAYMHGGLLVQVAVDLVGITKVGTHLLGASPATWSEACAAAGTSAEAIQAAYEARFAK